MWDKETSCRAARQLLPRLQLQQAPREHNWYARRPEHLLLLRSYQASASAAPLTRSRPPGQPEASWQLLAGGGRRPKKVIFWVKVASQPPRPSIPTRDQPSDPHPIPCCPRVHTCHPRFDDLADIDNDQYNDNDSDNDNNNDKNPHCAQQL